jgi:hypothetical protein
MDSDELSCFESSAQCGSYILAIDPTSVKGPAADAWTSLLLFLHQTYAAREGPYQQKAREIYNELRKNVVNNVFKVSLGYVVSGRFAEFLKCLMQEYERTSYVWEQYDAVTGEGKRR